MIELSKAVESDAEELCEVAIRTQIDTFGEFNTPENMTAYLQETFTPEKLRHEIAESDAVYYLARDGQKLIGFMRLRRSREVEHLLGPSTVELQRLYVIAEYHGRKVGQLLMKSALEHARGLAVDWIWLGVWERNFKAQEFYARWGFERFSEHVFQMGDDPQTDWLLRLRL